MLYLLTYLYLLKINHNIILFAEEVMKKMYVVAGSRSFYRANTPYRLYLVSVHQTASPLGSGSSHLITAYYSFIDPVSMKG